MEGKLVYGSGLFITIAGSSPLANGVCLHMEMHLTIHGGERWYLAPLTSHATIQAHISTLVCTMQCCLFSLVYGVWSLDQQLKWIRISHLPDEL